MNIRSKHLSIGLALVACLVACCGVLRPKDSAPLEPLRPLILNVVERHDGYVTQEEQGTQGALWLMESAEVTEAVKGAENISRAWLRMYFEPVAVRHDSWVSKDSSLAEYKRNTALRDSAIVRKAYEAEED